MHFFKTPDVPFTRALNRGVMLIMSNGLDIRTANVAGYPVFRHKSDHIRLIPKPWSKLFLPIKRKHFLSKILAKFHFSAF